MTERRLKRGLALLLTLCLAIPLAIALADEEDALEMAAYWRIVGDLEKEDPLTRAMNEDKTLTLDELKAVTSDELLAFAAENELPVAMARYANRKPSLLGVMCANTMPNSSFLGSISAHRPSGFGIWSRSYIESPLGSASSFLRLPSLKVAWKVKIISAFFKSPFKVSKSWRDISPRRTASSASLICAHTSATTRDSNARLKSSGVHSRTLLLTLFPIPKLIPHQNLGYHPLLSPQSCSLLYPRSG